VVHQNIDNLLLTRLWAMGEVYGIQEGIDMTRSVNPMIIQGGMGAGVSSWQLARAVSLTGQLGVVSGTALCAILTRRLQMGDQGGHMRRAMAEFPFSGMVDRILDRYFIPGGKSPDEPFQVFPMLSESLSQQQLELIVVANFVEVWLAKEGHDGLVGINYLEKIQLPTLPSLFGAMIAGVDYVLMGAGIPVCIPATISQLCEGKVATLSLRVEGAGSDDSFVCRFDPNAFTAGQIPWLDRPKFLPIIASVTLAQMLIRKASGPVDGFVVEGPTAGGHNAPPRGKPQLNDRGEPVYGDRDIVDLEIMRSLQRPFWLAGSYGSPEGLVHALECGAAGVQVGTAFAFCDESGLEENIKREVIRRSHHGDLDVLTDPVASPTGFPFKVLGFEGSLSDAEVYLDRQRICDLGFLRHGYKKPDGSLGWRCPAEPTNTYVKKGGKLEDATGRKCVCNGLVSNIGLAQVRRHGELEQRLLTCGNDVNSIWRFLAEDNATSYSAKDVVHHLLSIVQSNQTMLSNALTQ
jgi:nitronate monooxygenase